MSPADFMRFLFSWQHVEPSARLTGLDGLRAVVEALDGYELAADAWERAVLPDRVDGYQPSMLDTLCLTGEAGWARLSSSATDATQMVGATPIALFLREHADAWAVLKGGRDRRLAEARTARRPRARRKPCGSARPRGAARARRVVHDGSDERLQPGRGRGSRRARQTSSPPVLSRRTASAACAPSSAHRADGPRRRRHEIASPAAGRCCRIAGLKPAPHRRAGRHRPERRAARQCQARQSGAGLQPETRAIEVQARTLLKRYGVVFRRLLAREANVAPWRELTRVFRRLEARGEIRGGRFVSGMSGEQFALKDAIERLREIRRSAADGRCLVISAADPLNLAGIVTAGERVRAVTGTRVAYRDGVPIAAMEGDYVRPLIPLGDVAPAFAADVATRLAGRPMPAVLSGFVGRS